MVDLTTRVSRVLCLLGVSAALSACATDEPKHREAGIAEAGIPDDAACPWDAYELLGKAEVDVGSPKNCGALWEYWQVAEPFQDCFDAPEESGTVLAYNACDDCVMLNYFFSTPDGSLYRVYLESDVYGDATRQETVEQCEDVQPGRDEGGALLLTCTNPSELYACEGPLIDE